MRSLQSCTAAYDDYAGHVMQLTCPDHTLPAGTLPIGERCQELPPSRLRSARAGQERGVGMRKQSGAGYMSSEHRLAKTMHARHIFEDACVCLRPFCQK